MAWAPFVIAAAAVGYSAYSQVQISSFNEKMANQEADYQRQLGEVKESRQRRNMRKAIGEQTVAAAASGVSLLSGSIMDAFTESTSEGIFDSLMIRNGAKAETRGALIKASEESYRGRSAAVGGFLGVAAPIAKGYAKGVFTTK